MKAKFVVLGAGISGLAFAGGLKSDNYVIIEKEREAGGLCRTHIVEADGTRFVWDYAGHFFHFKDENSRKYFEPVLSEREECVSQIKRTKIYINNQMIDYPFQKNIHQLDKDDFIDCLYHLFFREEKQVYKTFKEMLLGKFGKGICERFLFPYNEKLYACDLNRLDQGAMGRFFPYADLDDIIRNMKEQNNISYNDKFIYPRGGAQTVIKFLLDEVDKNRIRLNEEVREIDCAGKRIVTTKDTYEYDYLISSIPFNRLMSLTGMETGQKLSWNKVLVFNIGFDRPPIDSTLHWIYYPDPDVNFYRVGFYNNILRQEKLSVYVEIGFSNDWEIDVDEQYDLTLLNLRKCGVIDHHNVLAHESIVIDPAYVHISAASKIFTREKEKELAKSGVYVTGRYGKWTYCSMEDCFIQARKLAEKLEQGGYLSENFNSLDRCI